MASESEPDNSFAIRTLEFDAVREFAAPMRVSNK